MSRSNLNYTVGLCGLNYWDFIARFWTLHYLFTSTATCCVSTLKWFPLVILSGERNPCFTYTKQVNADTRNI